MRTSDERLPCNVSCKNKEKQKLMHSIKCLPVCRDLKMENIMLDESLRNIKLIGETLTFTYFTKIWTMKYYHVRLCSVLSASVSYFTA